MASVFLSYDHEDAARAAPIAAALEKAGHSVWWDRQIHGGAEFNSAIENAVDAADVVVVLWSARSVKSAWVRDEAAEGRDAGKLVPVLLEPVKPPMGFRQYQTVDWANRRARKSSPLAELLHAIDTVVGSPPAGAPAATDSPQEARRRIMGLPRPLATAAAAALVGAGLLLWRPWASEASAVVVVTATDPSRASQDYARDLLAQLGQLQSAKPDALQLVGGNATKHASLVFEVAGSTEGQQARANLVLIDPESRGLLWSKAFQRPIADIGDLRQELGYTSAQVLECSVEAHSRGRPALKFETLKQYLNGCAELAHGDFSEPSDLIPVFRRVIAAAPQFEGAWGKLISAETAALVASADYYPGVESLPVRKLRQDIASARKINPELPEAYLAEADLLPLNAFNGKLSLVERAVGSGPNNAMAVGFRSSLLFGVGRLSDALDDARRAAELNPVSPRARQNYIFALAQAGRTPAALEEIAKAERIWPGSSAISDARFAINLRFGDPRVA